MGLDETVKDLEAKLARVEKELSDLKDKSQKELQKLRSDLTKFDQVEKDVSKFQDETKKDIDQFRLDSIQTLRDLPGNIADSESKMLDKQNRGLTLALSRQNWSLAAASILIALIGGAFTWWINKQLAEFDQKTTTVTNLLEDLRSAPDLAYQRLRKEEVYSTLNYIKDHPDKIDQVNFLFESVGQLPDEAFDIFRKFVIEKKPYYVTYSMLLLKKFTRKIAMREDPDLIEILSQIEFFPIGDGEVLDRIILDLSNYQSYDSSKTLIRRFLQYYLGHTSTGAPSSTLPARRPKTEEAFRRSPELLQEVCGDKPESEIYKKCKEYNLL
jgi:hypothetical protein